MKIIYSDQHMGHAPIHQVFGHGLHPAVEVPGRVERILQVLKDRQMGEVVAPSGYDVSVLKTVHDEGLLNFLACVYKEWEASGLAQEMD